MSSKKKGSVSIQKGRSISARPFLIELIDVTAVHRATIVEFEVQVADQLLIDLLQKHTRCPQR